MVSEIRLRQLDTNREETRGEDDSHDFEGYPLGCLRRAPGARVEDVGDVRSHEDAKAGAEYDFIDVELRYS